MPLPKQSPPHPQPGPDPRDTQQNRRVESEPADHPQSPDRATMDPLPPAREEDEMVSQEGGRLTEAGTKGVSHRAGPVDQAPQPSEASSPPVEDDRG